MILYLDTSSLVKLYVVEPGSEDVQRLVERAELVSTSIVACAEGAQPSRGVAARTASPLAGTNGPRPPSRPTGHVS